MLSVRRLHVSSVGFASSWQSEELCAHVSGTRARLDGMLTHSDRIIPIMPFWIFRCFTFAIFEHHFSSFSSAFSG